MDHEFLCIIPARGGSKGLKRKNVKLLGGKPLITWTINEAMKSNYLSNVYVSTEDEEIANISINSGAKIIKRSIELAMDNTSSVDVILDAINYLNNLASCPKNILLLQCTSPLRNVDDIDNAILNYLQNIDKYDSLVSISKPKVHPFLCRVINDKGVLQTLINYDKNQYYRRQSYPDVYHVNGAIYIIKTDVFLKQKSFETNKTFGFVMDSISSLDIDDEIDFKIAEYYIQAKANLFK